MEPFKNFGVWLNYIKEYDTEPTEELLNNLHRAEQAKDPTIDLVWMNRQIYSILSLKTSDTPW